MKKSSISRHEQRWHELFGKQCSSESTVECRDCGDILLGDDPMYEIVCLNCWKKHNTPDPIGELMDATDTPTA